MSNNHQIYCQNNAEKDACVPRMRTINEASDELKALDPRTAMSPYHIRRLCLDGVLPTVKAGNKILLNFDTLIEYMNNPTAEQFRSRPVPTVNGIRRVL